MGQPLPQDLLNTNINPSTSTTPNITINNPPSQYFTAEQLEAARQQEKDKLYDRLQQQQQQIDAFKTDMETYKQEREAAQQAAQKAANDAAEAQRLADEEKLSVTELLKKRDDEWKQRQTEMENKFETERAIMERDRELFALQSYIQRRVSEEVAHDTIAPEFVDLIDGSNQAEVEASITRMKEKTASIVAGMGGQPRAPVSTPGVSPTGFAPTGPLDNLTGTKELTPEDIRNMSNSEYAKFRAQVGIDKAGNNRGLFN